MIYLKSFLSFYSLVLILGFSMTAYMPSQHFAMTDDGAPANAGSSGGAGAGGSGGGGSAGGGGSSGGGDFGGGYANPDGSGVTESGVSYSETVQSIGQAGDKTVNSFAPINYGSSFIGSGNFNDYDPGLSNEEWAQYDQQNSNSVLEYDPQTGLYNLPNVFENNDSQSPTELAGPPTQEPSLDIQAPTLNNQEVNIETSIALPSSSSSPNVAAPDLTQSNITPSNNTAIGSIASPLGSINFTSTTQTTYLQPSIDYELFTILKMIPLLSKMPAPLV